MLPGECGGASPAVLTTRCQDPRAPLATRKRETRDRASARPCAGDSLWQPQLGFAQDSPFGITRDGENSVSP